jgi:nitroimidazol reductase NimA-like FMN-containing flavoprotein (pyridoxamine 5'-phosphate oxidase superfamily)
MPRVPIPISAAERVLETGELVRVCFRDNDSVHLIPLGYVWLDGALYGVTEAGRKTELASANPRVTFQVDTSRETGLFEWESVMGHGDFELVTSPQERAAAIVQLEAFVARAPGWWKAEQGPKLASGQLLVWRVRPAVLTGVRFGPPF